MQMTYIEENILQTVQHLPVEKQQEILDFSLFLKNKIERVSLKKSQKPSFSSALHDFLADVKNTPIEIDTQLFDNDRAVISGRNLIFNWFN